MMIAKFAVLTVVRKVLSECFLRLQQVVAATQDQAGSVEEPSKRPVGPQKQCTSAGSVDLEQKKMIYSVRSSKSLAEIDQAIREAAQRHRFGVLNVLDLKQTLSNKGIDLGRECRVYDVCNPQAAASALGHDMSASVVLPCRISVFADGGNLLLATLRPTDLMKATGLNGVESLALEIEREVFAIMDEAA